jgi:hypothetical protein
VATIQGFGAAGADAHFAGVPIGYRVLPPWSSQKAGTAVFPAAATQDIITDGEDAYWLGGKKMAKTNSADATSSWKNDVVDIPTYTYAELTSDYKPNGVVDDSGVSKCTEWGTTTDGDLTHAHKANCKTGVYALADNMYSWVSDGVYRVNVLNRMLQRETLAFAQTSGFTTIIVVQWADLMICKTRWLSIRQQGMRNPLMNFGLLFETILGACVCFVPFLNAALQTRPLRFTHWFPGMPFMVIIFMYDEIRKYIMRSGSYDETDPVTGQVTKKFNWVGENTYY